MRPENILCVTDADSIRMCKTGTIINQNQKAGVSEQITGFFEGILSTKNWPARWYCGEWTDFHGWLYIISDLLIWSAYFLIPVFLMKVVMSRRDFPFPKTIWLFVAFIVLCGTTHFIDALIFWVPVYRLSALVRFFTAAVSLTTVFYLFKIFPNILSIRSVSDLQKEITERNIVEEKLAASEFLLTAAGEVGRLGGWEFDLTTKEFKWTQTSGEIFEMDETLIVTEEDLLQFFSETDQMTIKLALLNSAGTKTSWDHELKMRTSRHGKWVRFSGSAVIDRNDEVTKIRGVIMDIDRYKTAELNLIKSIDQMAQQNNQLKNFTHILSNNLRDHSSNIESLTTFVDEPALSDGNLAVFQRIKTVSKNLDHTLNDLSEIIKIRDNNAESEELDIYKVTNSVLSILSESIIETGTTVDLKYDFDTIIFPQAYMESILINLISNGIKYKRDNAPAHISLKFYLNGEGIKELRYTDDGKGINLDLHADKVFGLYKTFHNHKDAHGVGLFLIKNQIEAQGGRIQVFSKVNQGTTFKITFNEYA
ncbi:sensor histidine kinase [Dyadobacter luticola]|uniref:histidine kinase n=1 Tax=Dyadobacter luticola TaxID=1979387 RepID=A0A5R9KV89_9BACT|nr:PAS domain-containing sensor histidine kinase [Dyadobacter luticola]TLV00151.1 PAS domain-containing sensor histidine kinase [Dyadobacter luticola]